MDKSEKIVLFVVLGIVSGCVLIILLCGGIFFLADRFLPDDPTEQPSTTIIEPYGNNEAVCTVEATAEIQTVSVDSELLEAANGTLEYLQNVFIPSADLNDLAEKFDGKQDIPTQLTSSPRDYEIGDRLNFYKLDENNENVLTSATLRYETENVYFWAEDAYYTDKRELKELMDTFSNEIYPIDQEFFGTEWIPGVDNDPHLFILYAGELGDSLAGYASTADCVLPEAQEYSNVKEMFTINADVQTLSDPYTLSVMAHELQHVIHGYRDPNEELWLNEGFSELATLLNGYDAGGFDSVFASDPDIQLNDWSDDSDLSDSNYGASFLFTTYLLDRFGEEATRAVVADQENGFASLDNVFRTMDIRDPLSDDVITADGFFVDWTITNYLHDSTVVDGRYEYSNYPYAPRTDITESFYSCSGVPQVRTVHQYGTDYYEIGCGGKIQLQFSGDATIGVLPDSLENDGFFMWSNRADASDTMLTRDFDLSNTQGKVSISFDTWYDLENDFDYIYLMASVDGGKWQIVDTTSCTTLDPSGNSYGCGYNGQSEGWRHETADLSRFAGKRLSLRFEYVTDGAINYEGFAVDNVEIPAINYFEDFEAGEGGWTLDGFARIQNNIPQTFLVSLISNDGETKMDKYTVAPGEKLVLDLDSSCLVMNPILVVSGSSRYTRQKATYTIELSQ